MNPAPSTFRVTVGPIRWPMIFGLLLLCVSSSSHAAAVHPPLTWIDPGHPLPALAFYNGQPAKFSLWVGPDHSIVADLFLVSNGTAAPLHRSLPVTSGQALVEFDAQLPIVEKPSRFGLLYREGQQPIAEQKLEVVPEKPGDFFREFLTPESGRTLSLFGTPNPLREFLISQKIDFLDLGNSLPAEAVTATGGLPEDRRQLSGVIVKTTGAPPAILIFAPHSSKPAGVFSQGRTALITLPLAPGLGTDPRIERLLLQTLATLIQP